MGDPARPYQTSDREVGDLVCGNQTDAGTYTTHHSEAPMSDDLGRQTQHFDGPWKYPPRKHQRGLGLGWHVALLFVLLTALFIAGIGWMMT